MKRSKDLERVQIPRAAAEVAIRRIQPLVRQWPWEVNREALERFGLSAYTQGLVDAVDVIERRGLRGLSDGSEDRRDLDR